MRSTVLLIVLVLIVFAVVMILDQSATLDPGSMIPQENTLPSMPD